MQMRVKQIVGSGLELPSLVNLGQEPKPLSKFRVPINKDEFRAWSPDITPETLI